MRTPSGVECPYFYGNYFRGRSREECRLVGDQWTPDLCKTCPVPAIARANACPHMVLHAQVTKSLLRLRRRVKVSATCNFSHQAVSEPEIGCGHCHELPSIISDEEK